MFFNFKTMKQIKLEKVENSSIYILNYKTDITDVNLPFDKKALIRLRDLIEKTLLDEYKK